MDRLLKNEIVRVLQKAAKEANEVYHEQWLTDKELCKHVGVFTKSWLKHNGCLLPRRQMVWVDEKGVEHSTSWCYPLHQILRMFANGEITKIRKSS